MKRYLLVILSVVMFGCSNATKQDPSDLYTVDEKGEADIVAYQREELSLVMNEIQAYALPEGYTCTPLLLSDDQKVYVEAYQNVTNMRYLGVYYLDSKRYETIDVLEDKNAVVGVVASNQERVIFEEYQKNTKVVTYYQYVVAERKYYRLFDSQDVPSNHFSSGFIKDKEVMFSIFDAEQGGNQIVLYNLETGSRKVVEKSNSSHPVAYLNEWYYLRRNEESHKAELIKYDGSKKVIHQAKSSDESFSGLYTNEESLLLTIQDNNVVTCLKVDSKQKKLEVLFTTNWLEQGQLRGNYFYWIASKEGNQSERSKYYVVEVGKKTKYEYKGNSLLLTEKGIVTFTEPDTRIQYATFQDNKDDSNNEENNKKEEEKADKTVMLDMNQFVQENAYYCGPAVIQMVLHYFGIDKSQSELAEVMHTDKVTGTEYVDMARVLNTYIFNKETVDDKEAGFRVQVLQTATMNEESFKLLETRIKDNIDNKYPVIIAANLSKLYPDKPVANHFLLCIGYVQKYGSEEIEYYYFIDPYYGVQDPTYKGLKKFTVEEVYNAVKNNSEPAYIW